MPKNRTIPLSLRTASVAALQFNAPLLVRVFTLMLMFGWSQPTNPHVVVRDLLAVALVFRITKR